MSYIKQFLHRYQGSTRLRLIFSTSFFHVCYRLLLVIPKSQAFNVERVSLLPDFKSLKTHFYSFAFNTLISYTFTYFHFVWLPFRKHLPVCFPVRFCFNGHLYVSMRSTLATPVVLKWVL